MNVHSFASIPIYHTRKTKCKKKMRKKLRLKNALFTDGWMGDLTKAGLGLYSWLNRRIPGNRERGNRIRGESPPGVGQSLRPEPVS